MPSQSVICEYFIHENNQKHWAVGSHEGNTCVFFGPYLGLKKFNQKRMSVSGSASSIIANKETKGYVSQGSIKVDIGSLNFTRPDDVDFDVDLNETETAKNKAASELTWLYSREWNSVEDMHRAGKSLELEIIKMATKHLGMTFKDGSLQVGDWSCSIGSSKDFDPYAENSAGHIQQSNDVRVLLLFAALKHHYPEYISIADNSGNVWLDEPKSFVDDERIAHFFRVDLNTCQPFLQELGIIPKPIDWSAIAEKSAVGSDFF